MTLNFSVEHVHPRYKCCSCLHVRTGTLLLAVFQIAIHFVIIAITAITLTQSINSSREVEHTAHGLSSMSFIQWERLITEYDKILNAMERNFPPTSLTVNESQCM